LESSRLVWREVGILTSGLGRDSANRGGNVRAGEGGNDEGRHNKNRLRIEMGTRAEVEAIGGGDELGDDTVCGKWTETEIRGREAEKSVAETNAEAESKGGEHPEGNGIGSGK